MKSWKRTNPDSYCFIQYDKGFIIICGKMGSCYEDWSWSLIFAMDVNVEAPVVHR